MSVSGQTVPFGIDMVQARDVWDENRDGVIDDGAPTASNRTICIIDSGLYTGHEDIQDVNILGGYTTIEGGWDRDVFGHGTHVAGTITAVNNALGVVGVTPGTVNLFLVRVFGDDGLWAYASTLIDAAYHCADAGANIISMSLGGSGGTQTERRGFDDLYAQGILSIASAGNAGNQTLSYPASYDSVVSIAAIDINKLVADFSQFNKQVELAAPGVGVLSTVPYLDLNTVSVNGVTYTGTHIEFSARGSASGILVDGERCLATGDWAGKVVLCERGDISFYDKVMNVQNSGGVAALIYNNVPGIFFGTLSEGNSSTIIGIGLSQEDGQVLMSTGLGSLAELESELIIPGSSYEAWDGTSMAAPHVSGVAALIWSAYPNATNVEIRNALTATAEDLGDPGRDVYYGFGLVQARAALAYLAGGGGAKAMHVADLDASIKLVKNNWRATVTITVVDAAGNPVPGVTVTGTWTGGFSGEAACVTGSDGTCSVTTKNINLKKGNVTFTVTGLAAEKYLYDPMANTDPDGDSNGTVITIQK